jgi:hypothetical protein
MEPKKFPRRLGHRNRAGVAIALFQLGAFSDSFLLAQSMSLGAISSDCRDPADWAFMTMFEM